MRRLCNVEIITMHKVLKKRIDKKKLAFSACGKGVYKPVLNCCINSSTHFLVTFAVAERQEFVYLVQDCPHDWLFPRCVAVVSCSSCLTEIFEDANIVLITVRNSFRLKVKLRLV